ncbi:SDR family NAD(P)-dependent oxidoreductase [Vibrio cholerae]|nr:SDR family NAD(P)-dependent oxidoreductase [Vibrio cholerae]
MTSWTLADAPDQTGRTALVTGANSGLGLQTTLALARKGARVLMACRDAARGQAALQRVETEVPGATVELVALDLAALSSVEAAAGQVQERAAVLDLLVDNAGVMATPRRVTADGFEMQLGTNHLGHFALTGHLLPLLLAAPAPRVVVVSSGAHRIGAMRFEDLQSERSYSRWGAYGQSKLANLLFARELGRRYPALCVAAAHPGYAATHLQNGHGSSLLASVMKIGNAVLAQSDEAGALPSIYAATMPDVRTGDYWGPALFELRGAPKRVERSAAASDDAAARRLWEESERLTGVLYPAAG